MTPVMRFRGPGLPLELADVPTPELRPGEMLVRVRRCALCRSDLHTHAGRRPGPVPVVLGHEVVGTIEAFGPGTPRRDWSGTPAAEGDRVTWAIAVGCGACFYCADGLPQKCERPFKYGHEPFTPKRPLAGGLAGRVVLVPNTAWLRVPDAIPDEIAASANCATATAACVLRTAGDVRGQRVLVFGAGVLGLTACAMARSLGAASVTARDPSADALARAARFGATDAVPSRGADVALELSGSAAAVSEALAAVRVGGTVVLAGTVSPVGVVPLDPEAVVRRMLTIRGVHNYAPPDLAAALAFLAGPGAAYPWGELAASAYPLERAEEAFAEAHARPGVRVMVLG